MAFRSLIGDGLQSFESAVAVKMDDGSQFTGTLLGSAYDARRNTMGLTVSQGSSTKGMPIIK